MRKAKMVVLLMAVVGMVLCLTGCRMNVNTEGSGLSDISYANSEKYTPGAAELSQTVEHIEINWPVGSVTVKPHGSDTVSFSEESAKELTDDARLHYWLDGATLHIQFCRAGKWRLDDMEKDLTVLVPDALTLAEVEVNSLSAEVCLEGLRANKLTVDTMSAEVRLDGLRADRLTVGTTSGNTRLVGCAVTELVNTSTISGELEAELVQPLAEFNGSSTSGAFQISAPAIENFSSSSISGSVSLSVQSAPKLLDIDTTSGNIDLVLPEDAAFTLDYDATSGELSSDLPYTMERGRYIFGDGTGKYVIGAISGDVQITVGK